MLYTPQEIHGFGIVTPEVLRDRRRRGLIDGIGEILLPDGSTSSNPEHPAARGIDRLTWLYPLGDVTALAIAEIIIKGMKLDLGHALAIAHKINAKVLAWVPGAIEEPERWREPRFAIAWPVDETGGFGSHNDSLEVVAVSDLNAFTRYAGAQGVVIDCKEMASRLPAKLRAHLAQRDREPTAGNEKSARPRTTRRHK